MRHDLRWINVANILIWTAVAVVSMTAGHDTPALIAMGLSGAFGVDAALRASDHECAKQDGGAAG